MVKRKSKARIIKVMKQHMQKMRDKRKTFHWDKNKDKSIKAKLPGKRKSASGNYYIETRVNRSDKKGSML